MRVVGMRRLVGEGITHAVHNIAFDTNITQVTACGILFVGYDSTMRYMFRSVGLHDSIVLRGTLDDRPVDCMSCLVGMQTWDPRWT